jgi:hypothetical protein
MKTLLEKLKVYAGRVRETIYKALTREFSSQEHNERMLWAWYSEDIKNGLLRIERDKKGFPHAIMEGCEMEVRPGD